MTTEKNFEIGQVVYILAEQAETILPGMVVEECVVKKLSGNSISWKVKVGEGEKAKLYDTAKIRGEVYGNLAEIRTVMEQRLSAYVLSLIKEAETRVENWYGKEIAEAQKNKMEDLGFKSTGEDKIDPEVLLSTLEKTPLQSSKFTPQVEKPTLPQNLSAEERKERLRKMAIPENEPISSAVSENPNGLTFLIDANGQRIPIKT